MRLRRALLGFLGVVLLGLAALAYVVHQPAMPAIQPPPAASFARAEVARGAELARLGNCNVCHTKREGSPYAGGRPLQTPFGTIYSTNITPDPDTGIGSWSEAAFLRAMREGVRRDGAHLYPAFPYDHFTKLSVGDLRALYGFLIGSVFAGVVGTGFYPLMGNRVWCRFGCPLAAYIGLVQRFKSRFRITTKLFSIHLPPQSISHPSRRRCSEIVRWTAEPTRSN